MPIHLSHRGRGTVENPPNCFESTAVVQDDGAWEEISRIDPDFAPLKTKTSYLRDESRSIISSNTSPDIGFTHSLNPYRGCEHGGLKATGIWEGATLHQGFSPKASRSIGTLLRQFRTCQGWPA